MAFVATFILGAVLISEGASGSRLAVSGNHFTLNGEHVFLSGGNLPWINYAYDFGNNQWAGVRSRVENEMKMLRDAGGNCMRIWIHIQGETSPQFDDCGDPIATDAQGTLISDIQDMLDLAKSYDLLVIPTLWNAAVDQDYNGHLNGLIRDSGKLQLYISRVLEPLVQAVKGHPALGAWDIINEPEGMLLSDVSNPDSCFDTRKLNGSGSGWAGKRYSYQEILRFINWQAAAIKVLDPQALVTVGVWNPKSNTDIFRLANHYTDACLYKAGNKENGKLDFYEFHSYSFDGVFDELAAFLHDRNDYFISKPIVIGEFDSTRGGGRTIIDLFDYVYTHGYAGALSYSLAETPAEVRTGVSHIRNYTGNGMIDIDL